MRPVASSANLTSTSAAASEATVRESLHNQLQLLHRLPKDVTFCLAALVPEHMEQDLLIVARLLVPTLLDRVQIAVQSCVENIPARPCMPRLSNMRCDKPS